MSHLLNIAITGAGLAALIGLGRGIPAAARIITEHLARSSDERLAAAMDELEEERRLRAIGSAAYTRHMLICPMIEPLPKERQ